jgi:hypothetical protein
MGTGAAVRKPSGGARGLFSALLRCCRCSSGDGDADVPELMDELVEEILLRVRAELMPRTLVRAQLVCKSWRRILVDPAFGERYMAFQREEILARGYSMSKAILTLNSTNRSYISCGCA